MIIESTHTISAPTASAIGSEASVFPEAVGPTSASSILRGITAFRAAPVDAATPARSPSARSRGAPGGYAAPPQRGQEPVLHPSDGELVPDLAEAAPRSRRGPPAIEPKASERGWRRQQAPPGKP